MEEAALLMDAGGGELEPLGTVVLYTTSDAAGSIILQPSEEGEVSLLNLEGPEAEVGAGTSGAQDFSDHSAFTEAPLSDQAPRARCEVCDAAFSSVTELLAHLKGCRPRKRFACPHCPDTFNVQINLELHVAGHRSAREELVCPVCERQFSRLASFRCHVSTLHRVEDLAQCPECPAEFGFHSELGRHCRTAHGETSAADDASFCCVHCGLLYRTAAELRTHKAHHRKIRNSLRVSSSRSKSRPKAPSASTKTCPTCAKTFAKKTEFERHLRVHTGEKPFVCQHCGRGFTQKGGLDQHSVIHSGERPFACQLCGAEFTQASNLRKHVRRLHPDNPRRSGKSVSFKCPYCPCIFGAVQPLNVHVSRRHPPDEPLPDVEQGTAELIAFHVQEPLPNEPSPAAAPLSSEDIVLQTRKEVERSSLAASASGGGKQLADISKKLLKKATQELLKRQVSRSRSVGDGLVGSGLSRVRFRMADGGRKVWLCPVCEREFGRGSDLVRHMRQHTGEKPYACQICPSRFSLRSSLNRHLSAHMGVKDQCGVCHKHLANPASLRRHLRLHHAPAARCQHCERSFRSNGRLQAHVAKEHTARPSEQRLHPAELQGEEVPGWSEPLLDLPSERRTVSLAEVPQTSQWSKAVVNRQLTQVKASAARPFACAECGAGFKFERNLRYHRAHQHLPADRPRRPYRCLQCHKTFLTAKYLSEHVRTHTGRRAYACGRCPAAFHRSSALRRHALLHSTETPFLCPYCPKRFKQVSREGHLSEHVRTHTGRRAYACGRCPAAFHRSSALRRHALLHSTETPFLCPYCPKRFKQVSREGHLSEHVRTHTGRRAYACGRCPAAFHRSSALRRHALLHSTETTFLCPYCPKRFKQVSREGHLSEHVRTHTGRRAYACGRCPAAFHRSSALRRHALLHSTETPFLCPYCPKRFKQVSREGHLSVHVRTHTGRRAYACGRPGGLPPLLRPQTPRPPPLHRDPLPLPLLPQALQAGQQGGPPVGARADAHGAAGVRVRSVPGGLPPLLRPQTPRPPPLHRDPLPLPLLPQALQAGQQGGPPVGARADAHGAAGVRVRSVPGGLPPLLRPQTPRPPPLHRDHLPLPLLPQALQAGQQGGPPVRARADAHGAAGVRVRSVPGGLPPLLRPQTPRPPPLHRDPLPLPLLPQALQAGQQGGPPVGARADAHGSAGVRVRSARRPSTAPPPSDATPSSTPPRPPSSAPTAPSASSRSAGRATCRSTCGRTRGGGRTRAVGARRPSTAPPPSDATPSSTPPRPPSSVPTAPSASSRSAGRATCRCTCGRTRVGGRTRAVGPAAFHRSSALRRHALLHSTETPFLCPYCPKRFKQVSREGHLSEHVRTHTGRRAYACGRCPAAFHRSSALRRHALLHSTETPFLCPYCPKRFKQGTLARSHIRKAHADRARRLPPVAAFVQPHYAHGHAHYGQAASSYPPSAAPQHYAQPWPHHQPHYSTSGTGEAWSQQPPPPTSGPAVEAEAQLPGTPPQAVKQRICPECGREFKKPSDFQRHMLIHTGEKPHQCHLCSKSFRVKSTLTSHLKTHQPVSQADLQLCQLCGSGLASRSALRTHLRLVHAAEQPHACALCHQAFRTVTLLREHEMTAHGPEGGEPALGDPVTAAEIVAPDHGSLRGASDIVLGAGNSAFEPFQQARPAPQAQPAYAAQPQADASYPTGIVALSVRADGAVLVDLGGTGNPAAALIDVAQIEELARQGLHLSLPGTDADPASCVTVDPCQLLETLRSSWPPQSAQPSLEAGDCASGCAVCETGPFLNAEQARAHLESEDHETATLNAGLEHRLPRPPAPVSREVQAVSGPETPAVAVAVGPELECGECGKAFASAKRLQRHAIVHTGEKAFACSLCGKAFGQKASLHTHVRRVHDQRAAEAFVCGLCQRSFAQKFNLQRHQRKVHGEEKRQAAQQPHFRQFLSL